MPQLPLEPCRTCELGSLRRAAMAAGLCGLSLLLLAGCARSSSKPSAARMSPEARAQADEDARARAQAQAQAKAQSQARANERAQLQREATALNQQTRSLQARANTNNQKASQLRAAAKPIEDEGLTNIAAGEAMCEAFDCQRGCEVQARGKAKVEKATAMRAEADRLDAEAVAMRERADEMSSRARDLLASMPKD